MGAVRVRVIAAVWLGMAVLSSCTWMKARTARGKLPIAPAESVAVEPTAEQQEAARKLLMQQSEQKEGQQAPLSLGDGLRDVESGAETRYPGDETPSWMQDGENGSPASAEPDAAQQRGLRSPALPRLLPMDINGKLQGTGVE